MFLSKSYGVLSVTEWVKICNKHYVPWRKASPVDVKTSRKVAANFPKAPVKIGETSAL